MMENSDRRSNFPIMKITPALARDSDRNSYSIVPGALKIRFLRASEVSIPPPKNSQVHRLRNINVNTLQINENYRNDYEILLKEFEDYEKMLESGSFSDIKLVAENQELKVHKNVLAARSQYFSDLLTQQDCLNIFEVDDMDYETLKIVVRYIYCAKLDDFNLESAKKIFLAAKKFILPGLTEKSKKVIIDQIAVDNIFELASFSESAKEEDIKNHIIDFVKNNITKFKETDLMKFNSVILAKVIGKIIDCNPIN